MDRAKRFPVPFRAVDSDSWERRDAEWEEYRRSCEELAKRDAAVRLDQTIRKTIAQTLGRY